MGIYGNMVQKNITSFLIEEMESFNLNFNEIEIVEESTKDLTEQFKRAIIRIFDEFIKFCKRIKETIKKFINNKIFKSNKNKAKEIEKKIENLETKIERKDGREMNKDEENDARRKISEASDKFLKTLYSNKYALVDTGKLISINDSIFEIFRIQIERVLETGDPEKISKLEYGNKNDFICSDIIKNELGNVDDKKYYERAKNVVEDMLQKSCDLKDDLWDKTHYIAKGYPSLLNFPSIHNAYSDKTTQNLTKYMDYISSFEKIIERLKEKTIITKAKTFEADNGVYMIIDPKKGVSLNNKYRIKEIDYIIETVMNSNIQYLRYMIELDMKGIKSCSTLLSICGQIIDVNS